MAHETFISYKFSDAVHTRDAIIKALGDDARYYRGENGTSPNRTDSKAESIKAALRDMIHPTSVTIVVCSPEMLQSDWIGWEIAYSLRETARAGQVSRRNGVVGVVQKVSGGYDWLRPSRQQRDGHTSTGTNDYLLQAEITRNRFNQKSPEYVCVECKTVNQLWGSYASLVNEEDFLSDPERYIDNAYSKSNKAQDYDIRINA